MMDVNMILIGLLALVALVVALWSEYERRQPNDPGAPRLPLNQYLFDLAQELLPLIPDSIVDEEALREWLLQQIRHYAKAYKLDTFLAVFSEEELVELLLSLLSGRYKFRSMLMPGLIRPLTATPWALSFLSEYDPDPNQSA